MALEGEHGVVAHHAASVVGDLNELFAARLDADLDARGAGVEGVFEHLLDHGRRPLHHFAGGDLVGNGFGEYVDAAHGQFSVLSTQYSVLGTQYSVLSTQYSVLSTQYSVLGTQFSVLSSQS